MRICLTEVRTLRKNIDYQVLKDFREVSAGRLEAGVVADNP
jgi:hypothetical protein